jgi:hypothetical protein
MLVHILVTMSRFVASFEDDCRRSFDKKTDIDALIDDFKKSRLESLTSVSQSSASQAKALMEYFTKSKLLMACYQVSNASLSVFKILEEIISTPGDIETRESKDLDEVSSAVIKLFFLHDSRRYNFSQPFLCLSFLYFLSV